MKFTKKMVEVTERAIDKKLTAEEIEKGKVETTLTRWYGTKKVVKIYRADNKKIYVYGRFENDTYWFQTQGFDTPNKKFEQAVLA